MSVEAICAWLNANKNLDESVLKTLKRQVVYNDLIFYMVCAYLDNDLDGEALAAAIDEGHDSLKELFPSLSHRLKIFGALKSLRKSHEDGD